MEQLSQRCLKMMWQQQQIHNVGSCRVLGSLLLFCWLTSSECVFSAVTTLVVCCYDRKWVRWLAIDYCGCTERQQAWRAEARARCVCLQLPPDQVRLHVGSDECVIVSCSAGSFSVLFLLWYMLHKMMVGELAAINSSTAAASSLLLVC
jgi:hypothetical protein